MWDQYLNNCLNTDPTKTAIIFGNQAALRSVTYGELTRLVNQIANSLIHLGFTARDAIAIDMPMNHYAVALYLGIIKIGAVVVSIADSFSPEEIATRLRIANAKAIFTQDVIVRDDKKIPLYEKVIAANAPTAIILSAENTAVKTLRPDDIAWEDFLVNNVINNSSLCSPMSHCNILFSSGTTGEPKAIPWTHSTAIKAATDAYLHHNIHTDDVLAWPTNIGWMMGPWLIFAGLINHAAIALYDGAPKDRSFGQFIQNANVTMLGVVPTLVAQWRQTQCMQGLNWKNIRAFSSTGESSNPIDMLYLMSLAHYRPVIEYCGGTEIGGAYISSTLIENNCPAMFTTPAMGIDFILLNEAGQPTDNGEVALIPPSIGLSNELLNADHHQIYFANMPLSPEKQVLRRHGDQFEHFADGGYRALGRVDDTMNLGGIKVSSIEIERLFVGMDDITETAAVAVTPAQSGPSKLVIYAVTTKDLQKEPVKKLMQDRINCHLNPLFKIHDVIFIEELPKTASNKIMRRLLRKMSR